MRLPRVAAMRAFYPIPPQLNLLDQRTSMIRDALKVFALPKIVR
jgi:hypothetical protein